MPGTGSAHGPPARSRPGRRTFPCRSDWPSNLYGNTIRQVARVSIGGSQVRIVVSNEYGEVPLKIGAAHIGVTADGPDIQPGSDHALTFGGESSITIPPGAPVISDPVDLAVAPLSELSVSLFFPESAPATPSIGTATRPPSSRPATRSPMPR